MKRKRVDVNLKELDQIIDHAREVPLSESESEKLKEALHALAGMLPQLEWMCRSFFPSAVVIAAAARYMLPICVLSILNASVVFAGCCP